ncbi:hypothetical protein GUJ93_ZPchr0004g39761 [Zizania palustris]|uniref:Uncharacterized protein n=1 Tax=Zizania palustris TaxID=103762 RepID=A0A8J5V967_ZIZPA|nr:hypothetical protein GUJ93_ZPchr0004g39761 [Zizania palustris]
MPAVVVSQPTTAKPMPYPARAGTRSACGKGGGDQLRWPGGEDRGRRPNGKRDEEAGDEKVKTGAAVASPPTAEPSPSAALEDALDPPAAAPDLAATASDRPS